jgi:F-type H+-transporting ATPase subunit a
MASGLLFVDSVVGHDKAPLVTAVIVAAGFAVAGFVAKKALKSSSVENVLVPEDKLNSRGFFTVFSELILWLGDNAMGKENRKYLPFIASLFLFIFSLNLIGLIPGFLMPTDQFQFNLGIALVVFGLYNYWGIKEVGLINYLKHLWGPVFLIGPMLFVIELISHCVRPVTLSLRLFGNMTGDHLALSVFGDLTKATPVFFIPVIFYMLGTIVCFIQAFVFSLLSMIYIRLAVAHEH